MGVFSQITRLRGGGPTPPQPRPAGKCAQGRRNDQREECPEVQLTGGAAAGVLPESRAVRAVAALAQDAQTDDPSRVRSRSKRCVAFDLPERECSLEASKPLVPSKSSKQDRKQSAVDVKLRRYLRSNEAEKRDRLARLSAWTTTDWPLEGHLRPGCVLFLSLGAV
ncbi:unnamed protein product [Polarella glacialis]|uniref:Uncharacterized protein n=1 Tax=Polarella glacialis TaxID=89957 RepID=A0A813E1U7_POLGL|nr:unnamed protein product [Polarella glacialis]